MGMIGEWVAYLAESSRLVFTPNFGLIDRHILRTQFDLVDPRCKGSYFRTRTALRLEPVVGTTTFAVSSLSNASFHSFIRLPAR